MLYVPRRFLFIHIPRTGGMAITCSLGEYFLSHVDVAIATGNGRPFHRHSRACELREYIDDWNDIVRVAVDRPLDEIVASDYRLHGDEITRGIHRDPSACPTWRSELAIHHSKNESLAAFRTRRWDRWLSGANPWRHWCCSTSGADLGVERIEFRTLKDDGWSRIKELAGVPADLPLKVVNRGNR